MKLAILGPLNRSYEEIRIIEEAGKVFSSVSYFAIPQINVEIRRGNFALTYKKKDLQKYDVIYPRIPRTYKKFGTSILGLLKQGGAQIPINPESLILSHNKFLTLLHLQDRGIRVPETFLSVKRDTLEHALDELDYPVVMKLIYGSKGAGVMFADSRQSAVSVMDAMERFEEPIFIEKFIKNKGEDLRLYVVGGKIAGSMKRIAKAGEMRSNVGIGGSAEPYEPTREERKMALRSAKILGMDICGIDIMQSPEGPVVIEANVNAQFQGLEKASSVNIAGEIIKYLRRRGAFWRT